MGTRSESAAGALAARDACRCDGAWAPRGSTATAPRSHPRTSRRSRIMRCTAGRAATVPGDKSARSRPSSRSQVDEVTYRCARTQRPRSGVARLRRRVSACSGHGERRIHRGDRDAAHAHAPSAPLGVASDHVHLRAGLSHGATTPSSPDSDVWLASASPGFSSMDVRAASPIFPRCRRANDHVPRAHCAAAASRSSLAAYAGIMQRMRQTMTVARLDPRRLSISTRSCTSPSS